jgi:thiamine monophosphate kinase
VNRTHEADRDLHRRLDASVRRQREEEANVEQARILAEYAKTHPDNSGGVAEAVELLLAAVAVGAALVALGGVA